MSKDPYFRFFTGDFLHGVADLVGDEIGAYMVIIALMHDRLGPIPDEAEWLARRAGLTRRRWHVVRAHLIELGKLKARRGMIWNPRALKDIERRVALSDKRRAAALARWRTGDEPELDLDADARAPAREVGDEIGNHGDKEIIGKKARKSAKSADANASPPAPPEKPAKLHSKDEKKGENGQRYLHSLIEQKPQISAETDDAIASKDSRARAGTPYPESRSNTNDRTNHQPPAHAPAREAQIDAACDLVFRASGFWPNSDGHRAKAREFVEAWIDLGIDIAGQAVPTIQRILAAAPNKTTGSLARFDREIKADHAAAVAAAAQPRSPAKADASGEDDDDHRLIAIREALRESLGRRHSDSWIRPCRMSLDGSVLRLHAPSIFHRDWLLQHLAHKIGSAAQPHGFRSVEIIAAPP